MQIGTRIRQARIRRGYSLRALAGQIGVSQTAVSKYEKGQIVPDSAMLCKLADALGVKPGYFLRPTRLKEIRPRFRKKVSMSGREIDKVVEKIRDWLERYLDLVQIVGEDVDAFTMPEGFPYRVEAPEQAEAAAEMLRRIWRIGLDPVESLTTILESHDILVGEIEGVSRFDACTFWAGIDGEAPVIVTRRDLPGDRQRFNLAHELGHLVLDVVNESDVEAACHRFAGALLAPASLVRADLGEHRRRIEPDELYMMKHRYGISMQALIRRAFDLQIISKQIYTEYCKWFSASGYRRKEPGDPVPREESIRFLLYALRARAEGFITTRRAEELLGRSFPSPSTFASTPL